VGRSRGNESSQRERRAVSNCVYDKPFREFRAIALAVPIRPAWRFELSILHLELRLRRAEAQKVCRFSGMSEIDCRIDRTGFADPERRQAAERALISYWPGWGVEG
jgi:hypothetical protein